MTNRNIPIEDITAFYFTVENVNFDAFYQRYRFYADNGAYLFDHETRERPGDYGPTTEADVTDTGTMTLTDEEWAEFLGFLQGGTVSARNDSADAGGDGPWTFLYWKNDKAKYQAFSFRDDGTRLQFEAFCAALAQTAR